MKTKYILLCCLLAAACVKTFSNSRSYAYWMEEPKWTEEREQRLVKDSRQHGST